jgi:multidrug efflux pump subunit AcrA (membrane-fusion protein)
VIPSSAIVGRVSGGDATCFRVEDGKAIATTIKVGSDDGNLVEVRKGLKEGDVVIVGEPSRIRRDRQPVEGVPDEGEGRDRR